MKNTFFAPLALLLAAGLATPAAADDFYKEPWFWGTTGLVTGGVLGYAIGHDASPRSHAPYHSSYRSSPYRGGYDYDYDYHDKTSAPVHLTGAYYVRDKRAFPFYRKTEIYPVASTMPRISKPQAVSMASASATLPPAHVSQPEDSSAEKQPIFIEIGDNNQDVSITINGRDSASGEEKETEVATVPNQSESLPGRMVDIEIPAGDTTEE